MLKKVCVTTVLVIAVKKCVSTPYLSFLLLLPFIGDDLLSQWLQVLATTLQLAAFTVLTHPLELFPGAEKVNVISTVAQQHLVVLWNGTGVADTVTR